MEFSVSRYYIVGSMFIGLSIFTDDPIKWFAFFMLAILNFIGMVVSSSLQLKTMRLKNEIEKKGYKKL